MPAGSSLADIAQKSVVLLLAGSTGWHFDVELPVVFEELYIVLTLNFVPVCIVYYVVNIGVMVNRRMELKKQGKLDEELVSFSAPQ